MKKIMIIAMLLLVVLVPGCGTNNSEDKDTEEWSQDIDKSDAFGACISDGKMVYIENEQLWIMDLDNKEKTVFCSKANCDHGITGNSECCEAVPPADCIDFSAVVVHGKDVYEFCSTDELNQTIIYQKQIGDSGRKKYATIPCNVGNSYSDLYAADKYIYFVADYQVVDSMGALSGYQCQVVRLNLETKKLEEVSPKYEHSESISISKLCYSENNILYCVTTLKDGMSSDDLITAQEAGDYQKLSNMFVNDYYLLDSNNNETKKLDTANDYLGIYNSELIYLIDGKIMITSGEASPVILCEEKNEEISNAFCSENGLYYEVNDNDELSLKYYDLDEKKLYSVSEKYDSTPIMISRGYIVLYEGNQDGQYSIQAVDLKDYIKE